MTFTVTVDLAATPEAAFALLSEPVRRPEWQASLRAVEMLTDGPTGVGTDVTWPGLRPLMEITCSEPGVRWSECGTWRGVVVDLVLDFTPSVPSGSGTTVTATGTTYAAGPLRPIGRVLDRLGPSAAREDLRRAGRLLGGE